VIAVLLVVVGPAGVVVAHTHHQELQQLQQQPLVYRRSLVIAVLLVVVGSAGVVVAPDDGHEDAQYMLNCI
jgi:hypothetical protein